MNFNIKDFDKYVITYRYGAHASYECTKGYWYVSLQGHEAARTEAYRNFSAHWVEGVYTEQLRRTAFVKVRSWFMRVLGGK